MVDIKIVSIVCKNLVFDNRLLLIFHSQHWLSILKWWEKNKVTLFHSAMVDEQASVSGYSKILSY